MKQIALRKNQQVYICWKQRMRKNDSIMRQFENELVEITPAIVIARGRPLYSCDWL